VFKIDKDASGTGRLWMKGSGIFEGGDDGVDADILGPNDEIVNSEDTNGLVLKAGDHFGVTTDGTIYATKGKIGNMEIGDIASTNDIYSRVGGKNLVLESNKAVSSSEYFVTKYNMSEDWEIDK
jgi:hypothetical protein